MPLDNPYSRNGLLFWTEAEIHLRETIALGVVDAVTQNLKVQNRGFEIVRVEAPLLTPRDRISDNYTEDDIFVTADDLALRPETTMGSYAAAVELLNPHRKPKIRPPLVVWQHGKSFRREQDQPTKYMRLKEFYQLEFQILFTATTAKDYSAELIPVVRRTLASFVGPCRVEPSDRVPDYADWTQDVVREDNDMEICSMSRRRDAPNDLVCFEVAVGTDRVVHNHLLWRESC